MEKVGEEVVIIEKGGESDMVKKKGVGVWSGKYVVWKKWKGVGVVWGRMG